jgi:hypothetical protein
LTYFRLIFENFASWLKKCPLKTKKLCGKDKIRNKFGKLLREKKTFLGDNSILVMSFYLLRKNSAA